MLKSTESSKAKHLQSWFRGSDWTKKPYYGVCGEAPVREALNAGVVELVLFAEACPVRFDRTVESTPEVLEFITCGREKHIAAVCKKNGSTPRQHDRLRRVLILDGLYYQVNIGNLLYLAFSLGIDAVYADAEEEVNHESWKVAEYSAGASFFLPVERVNLVEKIRELKAQGFYCVVTDLQGAVPLTEIQPREKMAFVLGNEANGVSQAMKDLADVACKIEMQDYDSLNVSVAGSILMYRFRQ